MSAEPRRESSKSDIGYSLDCGFIINIADEFARGGQKQVLVTTVQIRSICEFMTPMDSGPRPAMREDNSGSSARKP
jgi:hypothetical protein